MSAGGNQEYQHIDHGFDPVVDGCSRVLVLGSFPSVLSRANAFYYGNPLNRFWRVMAECLDESVPPNEGELMVPSMRAGEALTCGRDVLPECMAASNKACPPAEPSQPVTLEMSIAYKRDLLLRHGIALWDVIESCDIKGSSDASIKNVVPVAIERVLEQARIQAVLCNGGTAGRLYRRYLQERVGLPAEVLPSTSPANAAWSLERLIDRWREVLGPLL